MNKARPKNLDLFTIRFPLPAIVSILHRVSGVILFFLIPAYMWVLQYSLTNVGYEDLRSYVQEPVIKFILWSLMVSFLYHLLAGIRHLLTDIHIGTTLTAGRMTARVVFLFFIVLSIWLGVWIW